MKKISLGLLSCLVCIPSISLPGLVSCANQTGTVKSISISGPNTISIESEPVTYTANVEVSGSVSKDVTWSIEKGSTDASISSSGVLTPGSKAGSITITATSVANKSISDDKTVVITDSESKIPEVESYTEVLNPSYYTCFSGNYQLLGKADFNISLFNGSHVPYVCVEDYVDFWMNSWDGYHDYSASTTGTETTIVNEYYANAGFVDVTCIIDYEKQQLIFNDYDSFMNDVNDSYDPLASGTGGGEPYYLDVVEDYQKPKNKYIIDLSKYNIKAYFYADKGYLPFYVFTNILERHPKYGFFFDGNNFYQIGASAGWDESYVMSLYNYWFDDCPIFTTEYMQFCYDLLALTLDVKFGLLKRPSRGRPGVTVEYFKNGAYAALDSFHDNLISLSPDASNFAIRQFFNQECDDGGHAGYSTAGLKSTQSISILGRGPETTYTGTISTRMKTARTAMGHGMGTNEKARIEEESSSDSLHDILWVTLDSFVAPEETISYDSVDSENYMNDTISLTMYLQKLIVNNPNKYKYVVLDLSNNGGGTVYTEHFLASYLCGGTNSFAQPSTKLGLSGGVTETCYNPHTLAFTKYTVYADINRDGNYNTLDYLPSDIKLWCITSNYSFSCGNMLPCNLADCSNCKFIGDRTGGGACFVDSNVNMGFGNAFRGSSTFHMLKNKSTLQNLISVEEGVIPTDYYIENTAANANTFYNRELLIPIITA